MEVSEIVRDGQAGDGAVARLARDHLVLDLSGPGMDGIEATRRLRAAADSSAPARRASVPELLRGGRPSSDDSLSFGAANFGVIDPTQRRASVRA
jgi:DNA-binding response OmpR family regulator